MVTITIPALLRNLVGNVETLRVDLPAGKTQSVRTLLENLDADYPGLLNGLLYEDDLIPGIAVFIDNEHALMRLESQVKDGSTIHFVPPVVGGD